MVILNLNFGGIREKPTKADAPLVVDPYAVLPCPVTTECLQPVARDRSQVGQGCCRMNLVEFPFRRRSNALKPAAEFTPEDSLSLLVPERPNHN